ncbi:MAG TPA: hypothetical protein PKH39_09835 [Woeseiaceae bacterium]|nr:hypothetical protein [Woeseiaceae bacterium]
MRRNTNLLPVLATKCGSFAALADPAAVLDRDMRSFLEWFPGVYDNQEQVYFENELDVPEDERHERIHHTFAPVELPEFGENIFYVQRYLDDDPG